MEERELVTAAQEGDAQAFDALVRRHFADIYRYARRLLSNEADAEDATQQTFVRAWRSFDTFHAEAALKPWLFRIARNASIDILRKRRDVAFSTLAPNDEDDEPQIADDASSVEELAARAYEEREVRDALEELPAIDREILVLHFHDELSFREIGEIVGKPLHTVKSRARRALQTLNKRLSAPKERRPS